MIRFAKSIFRFIDRYPLTPFFMVAIVAGVCILLPPDVYAGPGGEVLEFAIKSRVGRIIFGILGIILLPLFLYIVIAEWLGIRKTRKDLDNLAVTYPCFKWIPLEMRIRRGVEAMYGGWSTGDLSPARAFLTEDYFESQQDILDRWRDEGKINVTDIRKLGKVQPLHVVVEDGSNYSTVTAKITMDVVDYMKDAETGEIIKGTKETHSDRDMLWTMIYENETWLLHSIGDGDESLAFARITNTVDTRYLDRVSSGRAAPELVIAGDGSEIAPVDAMSDDVAADEETPVVEVSREKRNH